MIQEYFYFRHLSEYVHNNLSKLSEKLSFKGENIIFESLNLGKMNLKLFFILDCLTKSMQIIDNKYLDSKYQSDIEKFIKIKNEI